MAEGTREKIFDPGAMELNNQDIASTTTTQVKSTESGDETHTEEKLQASKDEENDSLDDFILLEYKDPLIEDSEIPDNILRRNLSGVKPTGIAGLAMQLSGKLDINEEIDDFEEISMEECEEDEQEQKHQSPLSEEIARKVRFSINNSIMTQVKAINNDTIEEFINLVENNFPIDEQDWQDLKNEMRGKAKIGPKIQISCSRGKIKGYKKLNNIKLVAFIKNPKNDYRLGSMIEGTVGDYNDEDVDFNLDGYLMTPTFDDCVIRIEVRKMRTKDITGRLLYGYVEVPIRDVPSTTIESYYELRKEELDGFRKISLPTSDTLGHIVLSLKRDDLEKDPNIAIPNLVQQYFLTQAERLLKIPLNHKETEESNPVSYQVNIQQNCGTSSDQPNTYYQQLVTEDGLHSKIEENHGAFIIDCIMTNKVHLGIEFRRRSVSPGDTSLLTPGSHKRSSSLSPSQSMISLMTSKRRESTGSTSSLVSMSNENTPKKKKSSAVIDVLNKTIGSIGEDLYDIVSPIKKPTVKIIPMSKILVSVIQNKNVTQAIEDYDSVSWDLKIKANADNNSRLDVNELRQVYEQALDTTLDGIDINSWNGHFSKTLSSILNILVSLMDSERKSIHLSIAEAFMEMYIKFSFSDNILKRHIDSIQRAGLQRQSETLEKYIKKCLKVVEYHRCEKNKEKLQMTISNLRKIVGREELAARIKEKVEDCAQHIYRSWEKELMQNADEDVASSPNLHIQVCRDIINKHIYKETKVGYLQFQEIFKDVIDYQKVIGRKYLEICRNNLEKILPKNEKKLLFKYDEKSARVKGLTLVYETFCAMKRIFENINETYPLWLFELYGQYPTLWMEMALYKAEVQVENLLKLVRQDQRKFDTPDMEDREINKIISRDDSVEDITNATLRDFYGICDTCWKFRAELQWQGPDINLNTGLRLIEGLAKLENRIPQLFDSIHMQDEEYDVLELARTIKLLNGLLRRHDATVNEVATLHSQIANDDNMDKVDEDHYRTKMAECYELLQKIKDNTKEEIFKKIQNYTEGRRPTIKDYIMKKKLVNEETCLMKCIADEHDLMYENIDKKYRSSVMVPLWKVTEEELMHQFQIKKQRNLEKNKPERFNHFKEALPDMIDYKKRMVEEGLFPDPDLESLTEFQKEVTILTDDSRVLMNKLLRMKATNQKIYFEENQGSQLSMALKIAYMTELDKIFVEIVSIRNIPLRAKKTSSRIQLSIRFSPDRMGTGQICEETEIFDDIDRSIAFDLQGAPLRYEFSIDHISSKKEYEDGFVIINLFHVDKARRLLPIGECVSQVVRNGVLATELVHLKDVQTATSLSYQLHTWDELTETDEACELARRTDQLAKAFNSKEEKTRRTSFFMKFS